MQALKTLLYFISFCFLISGCNSLRKSQVQLIGNYYNTISSYPTYVRQVNERGAKLTLESDNLQSALAHSDSMRIHELMHAISMYERNLQLPDSISTALAFIEDYIQGYYLLAPGGFNVYKTLKGTTESISGIFGLRSVVSSVLPDKEVEVSAAKKKKITTHFRMQSQDFRLAIKQTKSYIDDFLIPGIDLTNELIRDNVQDLFDEKEKPISSVDHYFEYNKYFISYFQKIIQTRSLAIKLSVSFNHLLRAEREIQWMTRERDKIEKDSHLLHDLILDIQQMEALMSTTEL